MKTSPEKETGKDKTMADTSMADVPRSDLEKITIDAIEKVQELQIECQQKQAIIEVISSMEYGVLSKLMSWIDNLNSEQKKWMETSTDLSTKLIDARKRIVAKDDFLEDLLGKLLSLSKICDNAFLKNSAVELSKDIEKISSMSSKIIESTRAVLGTGFENEEEPLIDPAQALMS